MNDISTALPAGTVENPGTVAISTTLPSGTYDTAVGAGSMSVSVPAEAAADAKPESLHDVLSDEMKKQDAAPDGKEAGEDKAGADAAEDADKGKGKDDPDPKAETKPADEKKADATKAKAAEDGGGPKAEPAQGKGADDPSSEGGRSAPPARISDDARGLAWQNTPRPMKAEIHRLSSEIDRLSNESGEAIQFREGLRQYDDMARQAGTSVKDALDRYVNFDRQIAQDFGKGVAALAQDQGKRPIEAISSLLSAYGITPQQYAQSVTQNPQAHQVQAPASRDPMIQQVVQTQQQIMQRLEQQDRQGAAMQAQAAVDQWASNKPDFQQLEGAIAKIIGSGIIESIHGSGLSAVQRLDAAYRMAGGGNASTPDPITQNPALEAAASPNQPDPGRMSVRGAPTEGLTPSTEDNLSMREFLTREMRKMR